jgi:hypothetical protein
MRAPGMTSTCCLFWRADFMRRPWAIALEGDGKKDRGRPCGALFQGRREYVSQLSVGEPWTTLFDYPELFLARPPSFHHLQELIDAGIGNGCLGLGISQPCIKVSGFVDFSFELGIQSCRLSFEQRGGI